MESPLVTVLCITYNQVNYVIDMVESIVAQNTSFDYEVIIHDDASSDGTYEVLKGYEEKYPELISVIGEEENQWSKGVKITQSILMPLVRGKYVAFCEGDDFWIDHNKLQEQVDFLENNPEYVCVAHNALCVSGGKMYPLNNCEKSREIKDVEIINRLFPFLATASKVYRKEAFMLDGFFLECGEVGDMCTEYSAILKGKFYYIDKIMSIYRYGSMGSWSNRVRKIKYNIEFRAKFLRFLTLYDDYTEHKYKYYLDQFKSRGVSFICNQLLVQNISYTEFEEIVNDVREKYNGAFDEWLEVIIPIVKLRVYEADGNFARQIEAVRKDKKIYIYGAGDYAKTLSNQLLNNGIDYSGYIVFSKMDNPPKMFGKSVFELEEFVDDKDKCLVLVAVDVQKWPEIDVSLKQHGFNNVYCPFYVS